MGGFKGLFNIIWSNTIVTNSPIISEAWANDDTAVVLNDQNKKNRDVSHNKKEPNIRKNV